MLRRMSLGRTLLWAPSTGRISSSRECFHFTYLLVGLDACHSATLSGTTTL